VGRAVYFDPKSNTFSNDKEASAMLRRKYRTPYVVPDAV
jgi:hypothetical protein